MAMQNKKRENCLDLLSKQYGSLEVICLDIISKNILRIIKDIAHGNITKEDFEKYGTFFTNRQNLIAFKDFAFNRKNIANMYVATFNAAIKAGDVASMPQQLPQYDMTVIPNSVQPQMPYAVQGQPQAVLGQNQSRQSMWGSLTGQQHQMCNPGPIPAYMPPQQQYQVQPPMAFKDVAPMNIMNNPFDLSTNGLFAQIFDVECRKEKLWTYISDQFTSYEMNYEMFTQDFIRILLGFQSGLYNNFRKDFVLLDK